MHIIDKSFVRAPKNYIIQSLLGLVAIAIVLYFVEVLTHAAIVAALGASTFIVFAMPHSITAQPRRLVGGHIIGIVCGSLCYYIFLSGRLGELAGNWEFILWFACALSVGLAIFLMTITNYRASAGSSYSPGYCCSRMVISGSYLCLGMCYRFSRCQKIIGVPLERFSEVNN